MNPETLEIYCGAEQIEAALKRGEPLIEVPEKVAEGNSATRRAFAKEHARLRKMEERVKALKNG